MSSSPGDDCRSQSESTRGLCDRTTVTGEAETPADEPGEVLCCVFSSQAVCSYIPEISSHWNTSVRTHVDDVTSLHQGLDLTHNSLHGGPESEGRSSGGFTGRVSGRPLGPHVHSDLRAEDEGGVFVHR